MDDELGTAAELCRKYPVGVGICSTQEYERFCWAREKCLAAYLAEHPADDNEPVTRDWLIALGFHSVFRTLRLDVNGRTRIEMWCDDNGKAGCICVNDCKISNDKATRGDVRRLCRALGISLKEQSDA
jgi:hypothetical protein